MNLDRTYIIVEDSEEEMLDLRLDRTSDGRYIHFHHNSGTKTFDIPTAMKLRAALMAVLSGSFDRAVTETTLRLEAERSARQERIKAAASSSPLPPPKLENL